MLFWLMLACGPDIGALYEEERKHALAVASAPRGDWEPDLVVSAGHDTIESLVLVQLQGALDGLAPAGKESGLASVEMDLRAREVELASSDECPACLKLQVTVDGTVTAGVLGVRAATPVKGTVRGQLELGFEEGLRAVVKVRKIKKVELEAHEFDLLGLGRVDTIFDDVLRDAVIAALPPIPVVDLASTGLPILLLRTRTHRNGLRVEALTNVPNTEPASIEDVGPAGLRLGISTPALVGLVRRASFERGLLPELDVGIDPRQITLDGDRFTLDLRLWRLVGSGWWRDYRAGGKLRISGGKLVLDVQKGSVEETGASPGAALVDPLAALAQSQVLEAIATNLEQSFPAAVGSKKSGMRAKAVATGVRGEGKTLVLDAELRTSGERR